jgi:hypothetical protein
MRHPVRFGGSVGFRLFLVGVFVSVSAAACSSSEAVESGDPSLVVEVSDSSVTLENQTGVSLSRGEIAVIPQGIPRPYVMNFSYMSSGQKRTFALNSFRMSDGTPFRRGVATGRSVKVTATDVTGKAYEREVPFE